MATIVDSYSEANQDTSVTGNSDVPANGQSFTGDGGTLNTVNFYVKKGGSPTGNATAIIYAHTGTFGTSSVPTGSALATSGVFDVSTLTTSFQLITFTFTGGEKITLTNGTKYVVVLDYGGGDIGNFLNIGADGSSPSHAGNWSFFTSSWSADATKDLCFYVYKDDPTVVKDIIGSGIIAFPR